MQPRTPKGCTECAGREAQVQDIAAMITRQDPSGNILRALCTQAGSDVAFYLFDGTQWRLAATGDLTSACSAALQRVQPETLSTALTAWETGSGQRGFPFEYGWARHLYSGLGELLGLLVCLADGPAEPFGIHATRLDSASTLAILALEQRNLIDELSFRANHDPLTGLFNRPRYERELRGMVHSRAGSGIALVHAGLDRFRLINDVLGHGVGSRVLVEVAGRFQSCARPDAVLARTGGDEFALIVPEVASHAEGMAIARRVMDALERPFLVDGHEVFLNTSIGLACSNAESTPESLEHEAFLALHQAKRSGRGRVTRFEKSMARTPPERLEMEKRLRFALERQEFTLYYQPQVSLPSHRVTGAEALLRWRPEGLGVISPAAFIGVLEETGLILEVGKWVLHEACQQAAEWARRSGIDLRVGVNISALQIADGSLLHDVEQALAASALRPSALELELTESIVVADYLAATTLLGELRSLGVSIAIDDFGTGQSSLSYLHQLPFDRLKLDQMFIRPIADQQPCPPLVDSIIRMAQSLGMGTIAEGIETAHQRRVLAGAHCDEGQGYYFAPPLPAPEFAAFCNSAFIPEIAGCGPR